MIDWEALCLLTRDRAVSLSQKVQDSGLKYGVTDWIGLHMIMPSPLQGERRQTLTIPVGPDYCRPACRGFSLAAPTGTSESMRWREKVRKGGSQGGWERGR